MLPGIRYQVGLCCRSIDLLTCGETLKSAFVQSRLLLQNLSLLGSDSLQEATQPWRATKKRHQARI